MNRVQTNSDLKDNSSYFADYHVHTAYCGHAKGTAGEMVHRALQLGLMEIGFTGHFPYPNGFTDPVANCVIPQKKFPHYITEILRLQEEFKGKIIIRLAAEIDYLPEYVEQTRKMVQTYPLDYITGSVHIMENKQIDYSEELLSQHIEQLGGVHRLWDNYWQHIEGLISSEICDIVAHFDLLKKFNVSKPVKDDTERIDHLLNLMKDRNCVLEINTGGIDRSYNHEPYPSLYIIRMASEKKLDIILGSDAHRPEEIGRHFKPTREMLRSLGWRYIIVFQNRERRYQPL
ncbi:histidinol-phosphatase HisJ [bacterium]|nr:histidinol-phosphatase HisJ [bacterium]